MFRAIREAGLSKEEMDAEREGGATNCKGRKFDLAERKTGATMEFVLFGTVFGVRKKCKPEGKDVIQTL